MNREELQVENGHFTRIVNPLIEQLIKIPFKGCELSVALYIIRKTYGFQKKQDEISLTQFQEGLDRSRQTVVTALKNLQLVGVTRLVKKGNMKGACNIWEINKYWDTWKLVKLPRLVQRKGGGSLTEAGNLVYIPRHTKETTKERQKKEPEQSSGVNEIIDSFKIVNPSYQRLFPNKNQRKSVERLIKENGIEKLRKIVSFLPKSNQTQYMPVVTTPIQLEDKMGQLVAAWQKVKNNQPIIL